MVRAVAEREDLGRTARHVEFACVRAVLTLVTVGRPVQKQHSPAFGDRRVMNPDIARALHDEERAVFKELKQSLGKDISVKPDIQLHHEQFDLMAIG